jgi:lipopolysaccharide/colanic/teichoic acid biosynthesis glycosyltransferase
LEFKELIIIGSFSTISLFILRIIGLNPYFNSKNIPLILFFFITLSLFKEIIISILFENILIKIPKQILVIGSENDLKQIKSILKGFNYYKNISIELVDLNSKLNLIPDQLIISNDYELNSNDDRIIQYFHLNGVQIFSKSKWFEYELNCLPVNLIDTNDFLNSRNFSNHRDFELRIKRFGDIWVSLILIIISFPIVIISGFLIWINDRGPIFHTQIREGMFDKKIRIIKLRSMIINAETSGAQWSKKNDKRITNIGHFLRKSRIDELPQLISVLKGEMTLIGPRPERPEIDVKLQSLIPNYSERYLLKPGLSGWAQVNYPYGASVEDANIKLNFDLYYVKNISLFIDLLIFIKTIRLVFNARGAIAL